MIRISQKTNVYAYGDTQKLPSSHLTFSLIKIKSNKSTYKPDREKICIITLK